jgi:hypothetical protein
MHLRRVISGSLIACVAALAACDNGTTASPIPVYEASTADVGTFQVADAGSDGGARDAKADGTADATHPVDAGRDATDASSDVTADAVNDVVATHEAGLDAASDVVDASHAVDAPDAHD